MIRQINKKQVILITIFLLLGSAELLAQHPWQKPLPPKKRSVVEKILGPVQATAPSRDRNIVLVWGEDLYHGKGYHEYERFKDLWMCLLEDVPRITVRAAYQYPSKEQWENADLVVFYVHLDYLEASHYALMDPFLARGGGIVAIHESVIQRPSGEALAQRWGLAWNEGVSEWGVLPAPVKIDNQHPIMQGFPEEIEFSDEFYWKLTGDLSKVRVLGVAPAGPARDSEEPPSPEQLDGKEWPVFWTVEAGKGRVFGTVLGHNFFSYKEPFFRIILFRAMAWAMRESFDPFKPLVTKGVELPDK